MNKTWLIIWVCVVALGSVLGTANKAVADGVDPADAWLLDWETYVDLTDSNTINATAWHYPDASGSPVTINGNCADDYESGDPMYDPAEMDMTVTVGKANTMYALDVVVFTRRNEDGAEASSGIMAGYASGALTEYDTVDCRGLYSGSLIGEGKRWLARVPIGIQTSDANGEIHVFIDDVNDEISSDVLRGRVDGIVYYEPPTAPTRLITNVDRSNGAVEDGTNERLPMETYTADTDPLDSDDFGIQLGARIASDRTYVCDYVDEELVGADYVRMFMSDKGADGDPPTTYENLSYDVTFGQRVFAMVMVEDRVENQQNVVDSIVSDFASAGTFQDTGYSISQDASTTHREWNAYGAYLDAGTYSFGSAGDALVDASMYVIAAMPEVQTQIPGDTNDDQKVDETDVANMALNWGDYDENFTYEDGDFNGDYWVNATDASILAANWGDYTSVSEESSTVPEPSLLVTLSSVLMFCLLRRKR
jgi:hypothetical protein